jgi:hypothetical protein
MKTKASNFDKKFDDGKSVMEHLDLSKARRPAEEQKRINLPVEGTVLLAPDVLEYFSDSESVNEALRSLIQLMAKVPARKYKHSRSTAYQVAERK